MTRGRKQLIVLMVAAMMMGGLVLDQQMNRAFPKVLAQNLSMGGDRPNQMDVYARSSDSWGMRAFQYAFGSYLGGIAGGFASRIVQFF